MDIEEIEDWIYDLENDENLGGNVVELAALYIVKEHLQTPTQPKFDAVPGEINDILPAYCEYINKKRKQQLHELPEDTVVTELERLCIEIEELIIALYAQTSMAKERKQIYNLINRLSQRYLK